MHGLLLHISISLCSSTYREMGMFVFWTTRKIYNRIVFQCSSSDTKWIHGLQETVHDLWTSFFLKSSVALGMRRLAGRLHIETVKRSLRSRYATCQPTWAFQGPHETSKTMMWADHELFWAAHVFIEDRRRSIERISRFKLLLSFDRPENGSISTLNRFLCLLNRSQKPWKYFQPDTAARLLVFARLRFNSLPLQLHRTLSLQKVSAIWWFNL